MAQPAFESIVDDFEFLDDWEDRYRHVIELGKAMPEMPETQRSEAARVHGCASQVWMIPKLTGEGDAALFSFQGESDAMIVRGLIAILGKLVNDMPPASVAAIDFEAEIGRLGLDQHLSSQRSNGLRAMIGRIRDYVAIPTASPLP